MRTLLRRALKALGVSVIIALALFSWNGSETSWRVPASGTTAHAERTLTGGDGTRTTLTLMAWNIAKCDFHEHGVTFKSKGEVRAHLDRVAAVVIDQDVDLLFLSEIVLEAAPCQVNQVEYLAEQAGFAHWCYGDNYSFGVPGARIRAGNALLSKLPMEALRVDQLAGGTPFWQPTGNRRILWAEVTLGSGKVPCASLRNDSFDLENNAAQVREILAGMPAAPVIAGGDFNAVPGTEPLRLWEASGRFAGVFGGAPSFPSTRPDRRLDTILIPIEWLDRQGATWTAGVLDVDLSDHEPVVVRVSLALSR